MNMQISGTTISSNTVFADLIEGSLRDIIGDPHTVITSNLPYDGNHILALDQEQRPTLICCDSRDGGRALIFALSAIEGMMANRAWFYRAFPQLCKDHSEQNSLFSIEDIGIIILAPTPPPGGEYLKQLFPRISAYIVQPLMINDEVSLLTQPCFSNDKYEKLTYTNENLQQPHPFRRGSDILNTEEKEFLDAI